MKGTYGLLLLLISLLGFKISGGFCQEDAAVYIVTLKQAPAVHYSGYMGEMKWSGNRGPSHGSYGRLDTRKPSNASRAGGDYSSFVIRFQNSLLRRVLRGENYLKLYGYHYLINGFAILITPQQADKLSRRREVANVVLDFSVRTATTHTPEFLGLPQGAWYQEGGPEFAGKGIVIGIIDTGIDPTHPSFSDVLSGTDYPVPAHFSGVCEVTNDFPSGSCNKKLVGARHFAASAITRGIFNASQDHASPFDGDGHGTHTASIAAGNHGVPVNVSGNHFGNASGMAPHAHIAVYKALYKSFGGFAADVVAAIDQAILQYYNASLVRDTVSNSIVKFGAVAKILGGLDAIYSNSAPKVMYYSARGPDPEDNSLLANADILKPNIIAPGNFIWGAWSSLGTDSPEFKGENFAMISGTSMSAPHIAGLAALIKQKFPSFSPASIASALSTTATFYDKHGGPIMAQRAYTNPDSIESPATPFDMGSGFVNATAALDPGLIFDAGYDDYISFLCGINGSTPVVLNYTGNNCGVSNISGADLNLPSITVALLNRSRTITRRLTNIASDEVYSITFSAPFAVSLSATPTRFSIARGETQNLTLVLNATMNSSSASFGRIGIYGSRGHVSMIPLSVIVKMTGNMTMTS